MANTKRFTDYSDAMQKNIARQMKLQAKSPDNEVIWDKALRQLNPELQSNPNWPGELLTQVQGVIIDVR